MADVDSDAPTPRLEPDLVEVSARLERALVARFGIEHGLEAAAEAIAYAVEHRDRLTGLANPAGYLYRVGERRGRRALLRFRRNTVLIEEPVTEPTPIDVDLQRALMRLKPAHRVAVVLVLAHGHTYHEAAAILDVPVTTVTNHVTRGRARLRAILEEM